MNKKLHIKRQKDLNHCAACRYTQGITDKGNYIETKIRNNDRSDAIR